MVPLPANPVALRLFATLFRNADSGGVYLSATSKVHDLTAYNKPDMRPARMVLAGTLRLTPVSPPRPRLTPLQVQLAVAWLKKHVNMVEM